jgi:hypothetical protein
MSRHTRATTVVSHPPRFVTAGVSAREPQPGFLDGVLGLARRTEHAVGDCPQVVAITFESFGQKFCLVHRSHPSVAARHSHDERASADVTRKRDGTGNVKDKTRERNLRVPWTT